MSTNMFAPVAEVKTLDLTSIAEKVIFLSVSFKRFGNSRKADVEVKTDALQSRFRTSKKLLESPELEAIRNADASFKAWLDSPVRCWRYGKSGQRMVPKTQLESVYDACIQYKEADRPKLIAAFVGVYLDQVAQAKVDLKEQAEDVTFPSVDEVRGEFEFEFDILNFGTPDTLKLVSPKIYEQEKAKKVQQFTDAVTELRDSMRYACSEMVGKLLESLEPGADGKKKKLHEVNVTKLQEFLNSFDLRNVTDDAELQKQISTLRGIMEGVDIEKLRESENLKISIAGKLTEAKAGLASIVGERVTRKFR